MTEKIIGEIKGKYRELSKSRMKKKQLKEIVKEVYRGYENIGGKLIQHSDPFDSTKLSKILHRIATSTPEEDSIERGNRMMDKGDVERGNRILDRGNANVPLDEIELKRVTNVHASGPLEGLLEADIFTQGFISLSIYRQASWDRKLVLSTAVVPFNEFTESYVNTKVEEFFQVDEAIAKEVLRFVESVRKVAQQQVR